jgi:flagellar basal body rod protein FlgG
MNLGLYQSAAAMSALDHWQDAVAQNIGSSQSPGYLARQVSFSSQELGQFSVGPNRKADADSAQPASFPTASASVSFAPGQTQPTGNPLDLAIQGTGFFELQMPDGTKAYTRAGSFSQRSDGTLVNGAGYSVLNATGSPIILAQGQGAITVKPDGSLVQGATPLGKIAVQSFPSNSALSPVAGGLFIPPSGIAPTPVAKPDVMQGYTSTSNVAPLMEMVNLVQISRAYEANQKVITNADEQAKQTMDDLG